MVYIYAYKQLRDKDTELGHSEVRQHMEVFGGGRIGQSQKILESNSPGFKSGLYHLTLQPLTSHMISLIHSSNKYLLKISGLGIESHTTSPYPDVTSRGDRS